jgi:hypothetical protein
LAAFIGVILLLSFTSAQSTNPWSANSNGLEKNNFTSTEDVYVKSNSICEPAAFRYMPNVTVLEPADANETEELLDETLVHPGQYIFA